MPSNDPSTSLVVRARARLAKKSCIKIYFGTSWTEGQSYNTQCSHVTFWAHASPGLWHAQDMEINCYCAGILANHQMCCQTVQPRLSSVMSSGGLFSWKKYICGQNLRAWLICRRLSNNGSYAYVAMLPDLNMSPGKWLQLNVMLGRRKKHFPNNIFCCHLGKNRGVLKMQCHAKRNLANRVISPTSVAIQSDIEVAQQRQNF